MARPFTAGVTGRQADQELARPAGRIAELFDIFLPKAETGHMIFTDDNWSIKPAGPLSYGSGYHAIDAFFMQPGRVKEDFLLKLAVTH